MLHSVRQRACKPRLDGRSGAAGSFGAALRQLAAVAGCLGLAALGAWAQPAQAFTLFEGQSADGAYSLLAYARADQDVLAYKDVPDTVQTRSTRLRRARLGLRLRWNDDWYLRAAGNFAYRPSLRDFWLEYRGWPVRLQFGRFPEPFSLGESLSSSDTLLIARPSPTFLGPDYGFGAGFNYRGGAWGLSAGAFTRNAGYSLSGKYPENALSMRGTWRPLLGDWGYWHVGASASLRQTKSGSGVQLFGSAETLLVVGLSPRAALQTQTDHYRLFGGETALRLGPVLALGEYIRADVNGGPSWHGEYLEAAWCLTGERRSYSTRYGTVGGVAPIRRITDGGYGAWELAARFSATDLRDGGGDRGRVVSAGVNWYPVDLVRISLAAERAHRDLADGSRRDGTIAQLQLQLGF